MCLNIIYLLKSRLIVYSTNLLFNFIVKSQLYCYSGVFPVSDAFLEPVAALEPCGRLLLLKSLVLCIIRQWLLHHSVIIIVLWATAYDWSSSAWLLLLQLLCVVRRCIVAGSRATSCSVVSANVWYDSGSAFWCLVTFQVEGSWCMLQYLILVAKVGTDGLGIVVGHGVALTTNNHTIIIHNLAHHLSTFNTLSISFSIVCYLIKWRLHAQFSNITSASCYPHTCRSVILVGHMTRPSHFDCRYAWLKAY